MGEQVAVEREWIGLCRAGDLAAWRALYDHHLPVVYRVARRMGVPESDCRDLCQEVFLRVHRGLGRFREEAQFSTWLYRIVLHEVARARRARTLRNTLLALLGHHAPPPPPPPVPDDLLARNEATAMLEYLLGRMKPKHRQVFVLHELERLPLGQLADTLGCPPETVRSRLRHAWIEFERLRRQCLVTGSSR